MDRSQPLDAFSKTLESKPRHSHIHQLKQQHSQDNNESTDGGGSTVNRLSRVFETSQSIDKQQKPIPPSKPPSLTKPSTSIKSSRRQPPPPPPMQPQYRSSQQPKPEVEIDQMPLAFKDIRARFQQDNALPIRNQQASLTVLTLFVSERLICIIVIDQIPNSHTTSAFKNGSAQSSREGNHCSKDRTSSSTRQTKNE